MGGKVAMQFAIDYSKQVDRLVIVDIAPKPYEPSQRYLFQALRALDLIHYKSFADVDTALAPKVSSESLRQFLLKNLTRVENGGLRWKMHLEAIDRNYDKLLRGLAPERSFSKPTLFIRGGQSKAYSELV